MCTVAHRQGESAATAGLTAQLCDPTAAADLNLVTATLESKSRSAATGRGLQVLVLPNLTPDGD